MKRHYPQLVDAFKLPVLMVLLALVAFEGSAQTLLTDTRYLDPDDLSTRYREYTYYVNEAGTQKIWHGLYREWWVNWETQTVLAHVQYERTYVDGDERRRKSFRIDGTISLDQSLQGGKLNGPTHNYYQSAALSSTVEYLNDQVHGSADYYAENGQRTSHSEWANGIQQGLSASWLEDGTPVFELNYDGDGQLDGPAKHWVTSGTYKGRLADLEEYTANTLTMATRFTYPSSGATNITRNLYENGNGFKHGEQVIYNFNPVYLKDIENYDHGVPTGEWTSWWSLDQMKCQGSYLLGKEAGRWTRWYNNGQLQDQGFYNNGLKNGQWQAYFADGNLNSDYLYSNGNVVRGWLHTLYHPGTSQPQYSHEKSGELIIYREFTDSGQILSESSSFGGVRVDVERQWTPAGVLIREVTWQGGQRTFERRWLGTGQIVVEETYANGQLNGPATLYAASINGYGSSSYPNPMNPVIKHLMYVNGVLNGPTVQYFFYAGNPAFSVLGSTATGQYSNGNPCGAWVSVDDTSHTTTQQYAACSPSPTPPPDFPDPKPGSVNQPTVREIRGRVSDQKSGLPLASVTVTTGSASTTTDSGGNYQLILGGEATQTLSFTLTGYSTVSGDIPMGNYQSRAINVRMYPKKPPGVPEIISVDASKGWLFFSDVTRMNDYLVSVDWNGSTPQKVIFDKNGSVTEVSTSGAQASQSYNMGTEFTASLDPKANILQITAVNTDGEYSDSFALRPVVLPHPVWAVGLGGNADGSGYTLTGIFPDPPLDLSFKEADVPAAVWALWSAVPTIGGRKLGLENIQVSLAVDAKSDGSGSVAVGGTGGFTAAGVGVNGKLGGKGTVKYAQGAGLALQAAEVSLGIEFELRKTEGLLSLVPAAQSLESSAVFGRAAQWLNRTAEIEASVTAGFAGSFKYERINDPPAGAGKYQLKAEPEISLGIGGKISSETSLGKITVGAGGTGKVIATYPKPVSGPQARAELDLTANVALTVLRYTRQFEAKHTFSYPSSGGARAAADWQVSKPDPSFHPISLAFLEAPDYSRFAAPVGAARVAASVVAPGPQDVLLVQNAFPDAQPSLATRNGEAAIAYVYFDPADSVLQGGDINLIYHDGNSYAAPVTALNDTRSEFDPTLAFDANGKIVAAWSRVKDGAFSGTDPEDMAPLLEIVYASFDPAKGAWSDVTPLTDNGYLDHRPRILSGENDEVLLSWESNAASMLSGGAASPTHIHLASWNPATRAFAAAPDLPGGLTNVIEYSLAFDGARALLAYVEDMDGDYATGNDTELFTTTYDGGTWGARARVTDDQIEDASPKVLYKAASAPELVWLHGSDLARLSNWSNGAHDVIRANSQAMVLTGFQLTCAPGNHLAVIWQRPGTTGPDLVYSAYDAPSGLWSEDLQLTSTANAEQYAHGIMDASGKLQVVYAQLMNEQTGSSDLHHLIYPLARDLAPAGLQMTTVNPAAGAQVNLVCQIANTGAYPVENVSVAFYDGDPAGAGQLIGTATATPSLIRGGATGEAQMTWMIPSLPTGQPVFAAIDPSNAITESDEANNTIARVLLQPDARLAGARADEHGSGSVDLVGVVANSGLLTATNVLVRFMVDERLLGTKTIPILLSGQSVEVSMTASGGVDFTNFPASILIAADPDNTIVESDENNNSAGLEVILETDLDGDGIPDSWERFHFGNLQKHGSDDSDSDGMVDLLEFLAGTNPDSAASVLRGDIVRPDNQGHITIGWAAEPGHTYQVQYSESLTEPQWVNLGALITTSGQAGVVVDQPPANSPSRYYRVIMPVR